MKKRIGCALLAALLLCPGALGEEMPTLILRNGREAAVRQWEKRGGFRLEYGIYDGEISLAEHLRGEHPPDLVLVSTYSDDWTGLMEAGLLADLSGNAVLRERVADLRPEMRLRPALSALPHRQPVPGAGKLAGGRPAGDRRSEQL